MKRILPLAAIALLAAGCNKPVDVQAVIKQCKADPVVVKAEQDFLARTARQGIVWNPGAKMIGKEYTECLKRNGVDMSDLY